MRFAFSPDPEPTEWVARVRAGIEDAFSRRGHVFAPQPDDACELVFHRVQPSRPRPFPRKSRAVYVVGIAEVEADGADADGADATLLRSGYPLLVRSICNMLLAARPRLDAAPLAEAVLITPEQGCYPAASGSANPFDNLYERVAPLASSHLVIDNVFDPDLPEELWSGTAATEDIAWASREIDAMELLPLPFPVEETLGPEGYAFLRRLFGIGGLSYGNLSARHDAQRFWMSASGVHKGRLSQVGRDILLVKGYDAKRDAMRLSVRPDVEAHRVSVDAIEHSLVYAAYPGIGAMLHVHAWVDGVRTTQVNYPCGTIEAGHALVAALGETERPERTVVGLLNHGITATGPDLRCILEGLRGRVRTKVPMQ